MLYNSILDLIGKTPIIKTSSLLNPLYLKLESYNPFGSVKDRIALNMINKAEEMKLLNKNSVIIEPTSGNTGIALAAIANLKKYKFITIIPANMSYERIKILKLYNAKVIQSPPSLGMEGSIKLAQLLQKRIPNSFIPSQFTNENNPLSHYLQTAEEINNDLPNLDIFIAGIGTAGTISGVGKRLKELNPNIKIIGVEPQESPLLSLGKACSHRIQGIGTNFIPPLYNPSICDEIIQVSYDEVKQAINTLLQKESLFVGFSGAAAFYAGYKLSIQESNKNKQILILIPDNGYKYLSLL